MESSSSNKNLLKINNLFHDRAEIASKVDNNVFSVKFDQKGNIKNFKNVFLFNLYIYFMLAGNKLKDYNNDLMSCKVFLRKISVRRDISNAMKLDSSQNETFSPSTPVSEGMIYLFNKSYTIFY